MKLRFHYSTKKFYFIDWNININIVFSIIKFSFFLIHLEYRHLIVINTFLSKEEKTIGPYYRIS